MSYFKNDKVWNEIAPDEFIYKEELADDEDEGYTKQQLIDIVKGNEKTARALFDLLEWQSPYTLLDEWEREGEIDENFNLIL